MSDKHPDSFDQLYGDDLRRVHATNAYLRQSKQTPRIDVVVSDRRALTTNVVPTEMQECARYVSTRSAKGRSGVSYTFYNGTGVDITVVDRSGLPAIISPAAPTDDGFLSSRRNGYFCIFKHISISGCDAISNAKGYLRELKKQLPGYDTVELKKQLDSLPAFSQLVDLYLEFQINLDTLKDGTHRAVYDAMTDFVIAITADAVDPLHPMHDASVDLIEKQMLEIGYDEKDTNVLAIAYVSQDDRAEPLYTKLCGRVIKLPPQVGQPGKTNAAGDKQLNDYIEVKARRQLRGGRCEVFTEVYSVEEASLLFGLFESSSLAERDGDYSRVAEQRNKQEDFIIARQLREQKAQHDIEMDRLKQEAIRDGATLKSENERRINELNSQHERQLRQAEQDQKLHHDRIVAGLKEEFDRKKQDYEIKSENRKSQHEVLKIIGATIATVLGIIVAVIKFLPVASTLFF
jgi:hypothetical protein